MSRAEVLPPISIVETEKQMTVKPFRDVSLGRLVERYGGNARHPWNARSNREVRWSNIHCTMTTYQASEIIKGRPDPEARYFTEPHIVDNKSRLRDLRQTGYAETEDIGIIAFPTTPAIHQLRYKWEISTYEWLELSAGGFRHVRQIVHGDEYNKIPEAVIRASALANEIVIVDAKEKERRDQESAKRNEDAMRSAREFAASRKPSAHPPLI
jgi:hypothetical protein